MNEPDYTPAEMMRQVEKLLGIGLEPAHKAPEMGLERVEEAINDQSWSEERLQASWEKFCKDDPNGAATLCEAGDDQMPVPLTLAYKTWAFEDFSDEWLERREAFSNEGEPGDDWRDEQYDQGFDDEGNELSFNEGLDDGEAQ